MSSGSTRTARSGWFTTSSWMRASNLTLPTIPTLRPKLRKVPRRSFSMAMLQSKAVLKAQINKTDRNDARGIAQMIRVGLYRPVHVKTLRSQKLRMLLTHRKLLASLRPF